MLVALSGEYKFDDETKQRTGMARHSDVKKASMKCTITKDLMVK
jgi:hypothetical protein